MDSNSFSLSSNDINFQTHLSETENTLAQLKRAYLDPKDPDHKKLKKTAQDFEAVFFKQMIEQMDKTVERSEFLHGGQGEDKFRSMLFDQVSHQLCTRPGGSGLGLAETIYQQMSQQMSSQPLDNIQKAE